MKVLIAADGSDYTRRALDFVAANPWLHEGHELSVFTAAIPLPHRAAALAGRDVVHRYYEDDAEQVLRPAREAFAGHGLHADFSWVIGHPAEAIVRKASTGGFALIVMGSHGHGVLANIVLGSVATRVLATCRIPVLLIR